MQRDILIRIPPTTPPVGFKPPRRLPTLRFGLFALEQQRAASQRTTPPTQERPMLRIRVT
jgi:hypothetical protein